ncbi:MAG: protocatechuate 3,4-dioxygenase subunit alpha [Bacteroidota bacterium]
MSNPKKHSQTPSQTVGPFFAYGLTPEQYRYSLTSVAHPDIVDPEMGGAHILITGQVFDGEGKTVGDAMLEFRQANHEGTYSKRAEDDFMGFGRVGTGTEQAHRYEIRTIKPGSKPGQAPHIDVTLFMRGMLNHLYTRIYFSDETEANAHDPILQLVPEDRQASLIATRKEVNGRLIYHFDIYMQGEQETVFFDV